MEIESCHAFRVIRNADLTLAEEEADDLLEAVEMELRRRRFGRAVCLQVEAAFHPEVRDLLMRELDLRPEDVYEVEGLLDYGGLWGLHDLDRPDLKDEAFSPVTPGLLVAADDEPLDIFSAIAERDTSCTTRTRALPCPRKRSSRRLPATPRCWPSSRPSTAPRVIARSSPP